MKTITVGKGDWKVEIEVPDPPMSREELLKLREEFRDYLIVLWDYLCDVFEWPKEPNNFLPALDKSFHNVCQTDYFEYTWWCDEDKLPDRFAPSGFSMFVRPGAEVTLSMHFGHHCDPDVPYDCITLDSLIPWPCPAINHLKAVLEIEP